MEISQETSKLIVTVAFGSILVFSIIIFLRMAWKMLFTKKKRYVRGTMHIK